MNHAYCSCQEFLNANVKIYKKSLIQMALEKDGRFKPIYFSDAVLPLSGDEKVPTVWVKVK